jgi:hypothetical protein
MKVIKNEQSPKDRKDQENAIAQAAINRSSIEYIAMMSDIDLPTPDTDEVGGTENE